MTHIPENFTEFLYWIKDRTELFWSIDPKASTNNFVCEDWIYGAKWIGLSDKEICEIETKYSITFTSEHKSFLKILHTIDRKERIEYTKTFEGDAEIHISEKPFFYNWLKDDAEIRDKFNWPYDTIFEDVIGSNKVWLKSWGVRPNSEKELKEIFTEWYNKAPKLLPINGHRFVINDKNLKYKPVLSVWGSDIIVYGWNLKSYLLNELKDHLNIVEMDDYEKDQQYESEIIKEVKTIFEEDYRFDESKEIPFWQELILFWTSGWASFGLKYQDEDDTKLKPIMKTFTSYENSENNQKTFKDF